MFTKSIIKSVTGVLRTLLGFVLVIGVILVILSSPTALAQSFTDGFNLRMNNAVPTTGELADNMIYLPLVMKNFPFTPDAPVLDASANYNFVTSQVMYQPDEPFHITDTRYADKSDFETRTLTVYQPYQDGQPLRDRPVVFFVHGGGWVDGYAHWYTELLTPTLTAEQGWVVVNVDYRLTSDQVFLAETYPITPTKAAWYDDNLQDIGAAFDWTVKNIAAYGGDTQNIFLFGHSAGGHLVSLLATHDNYRAYRMHMRGVISMSGAYNLNELNELIFGPLLDQTFEGGHTDEAALEAASPSMYVLAGNTLPPFYVLHCQFDLLSLPEQAISFRNKLEVLDYEVSWDYLMGYTHATEMTAIAYSQEAVTQSIVGYIEAQVRKTVYLPLIVSYPTEMSSRFSTQSRAAQPR
ncbi:MAG: alpha/beta hydrolase [Chloroflexi bacterium]|nr:alpha/beta hydrolase [Chloroflexota bacterium]